jgi:hypothetical protein
MNNGIILIKALTIYGADFLKLASIDLYLYDLSKYLSIVHQASIQPRPKNLSAELRSLDI